MKKVWSVLAALTLALALTGCSGQWLNNTNAEDLLVAPKTDPGVAEALAVVQEALGVEVQAKYPRGGDSLSPLLNTDLDGDGRLETVLFYTASQLGTNVRVAILSRTTGGGYQLQWEGEGTGTDIERAQSASFGRDWSKYLVVGYTNINLSEKYATVYRYDPTTPQVVVPMYAQTYSQMLVCDMMGTGYDGLLFASSTTKPENIELSLLAGTETELSIVSTVQLDSRLYSCTALQKGVVNGRTLVMADCIYANQQASAAIFYADDTLQTQQMLQEAPAEPVPFADLTLRPLEGPGSFDIDGDGALEVPFSQGIYPGGEGLGVEELLWYQPGSALDRHEYFGMALGNRFFMLLPEMLRGTTHVLRADREETGSQSLLLVDSATGTTLLDICIVEKDVRLPDENLYTQMAAYSGYRLLLRVGDALPEGVERNTLLNGFVILQ